MKGVFKSINSRDRSITPFKVYKNWEFVDSASLQSYGGSMLAAIKPNKSVFSGQIVTLDSGQTNADSGSTLLNRVGDTAASVIWYSLNHLYYKRAGQPYETFGNTDNSLIQRKLYTEASVFSISQNSIGETIKPNSVNVNLTTSTYNINLTDDGNGNLIDTDLAQPISNQVFYLRSNESVYEDNWQSTPSLQYTSSGIQTFKYDCVDKELNVTGKNVLFASSVSTSSIWGTAVNFTNTSYIRIPNNDILNFKQDDDFTVAFWYTLSSYSTNTTTSILSKRSTSTSNTLSSGLSVTGNVNTQYSQYPFDITYVSGPIAGTGSIYCKQATGGTVTSLSAIAYESTPSKCHLTLTKSGSAFQLFINGVMTDNAVLPTGNIHNNADVFLGSMGLDVNGNAVNGFRGSISEFFFFNKGLSQSEITQLAFDSIDGSTLMSTNTNIVGNVFYEHGIVIISDPRPKYSKYRLFDFALYNKNTGTLGSAVLNSMYLNFASTVTLYEHEYTCRINEDEFNFTSNSTIRNNNDMNSQIPKDFVSNPYFTPYLTTVGLYNDKAELVAVAKLASPVKKRDNVDLNVVVRFDL